MMDYLQAYICGAYTIVFGTCLAGAFSTVYNANLIQRLSILMLAIWTVWRAQLVWEQGWGYPHEPLLVTALALYAIGSLIKTLAWNHHDHRTSHATSKR